MLKNLHVPVGIRRPVNCYPTFPAKEYEQKSESSLSKSMLNTKNVTDISCRQNSWSRECDCAESEIFLTPGS